MQMYTYILCMYIWVDNIKFLKSVMVNKIVDTK